MCLAPVRSCSSSRYEPSSRSRRSRRRIVYPPIIPTPRTLVLATSRSLGREAAAASGATIGGDALHAGSKVQLGAVKGRLASVVTLLVALTSFSCRLGAAPTASPTAAATSSPSPRISGDWLEYHGDSSRAGLGAASPAFGRPQRAWDVAVDGDVYASPLIVAGHVLVATENNTVYSLDLFTGAVVWKAHLGNPV